MEIIYIIFEKCDGYSLLQDLFKGVKNRKYAIVCKEKYA